MATSKGTTRASGTRGRSSKTGRTRRRTVPLRKRSVTLSREDLLRELIDPEGESVERIISLTRMTCRQLRAQIVREKRRALAWSRKKCPEGCPPGKCTNLLHWVTTITPHTDLTALLPKIPAKGTYHEWVTDPLTLVDDPAREALIASQDPFEVPTDPLIEDIVKQVKEATPGTFIPLPEGVHPVFDYDLLPTYTARAFLAKRNTAKALEDCLRAADVAHLVDWPAFAKKFYALFPEPPKVTWADRIPYWCGWWWRKPYDWLMQWGGSATRNVRRGR